jgi:hypothetical protein
MTTPRSKQAASKWRSVVQAPLAQSSRVLAAKKVRAAARQLTWSCFRVLAGEEPHNPHPFGRGAYGQ